MGVLFLCPSVVRFSIVIWDAFYLVRTPFGVQYFDLVCLECVVAAASSRYHVVSLQWHEWNENWNTPIKTVGNLKKLERFQRDQYFAWRLSKSTLLAGSSEHHCEVMAKLVAARAAKGITRKANCGSDHGNSSGR